MGDKKLFVSSFEGKIARIYMYTQREAKKKDKKFPHGANKEKYLGDQENTLKFVRTLEKC